MKRASPKRKPAEKKPLKGFSVPREEIESAGRESIYRLMFESAREGILVADAGTGAIEDANPRLLEMLAYKPGEIKRKKVWQLHANPKAAQERFENLQTTDSTQEAQLTLLKKDGQPVPVEYVSSLFEAGGKRYIQVNVREIADLAQSNKSLRESERRLESPFENSPIPIWEEDFSEVKKYLEPLGLTGKSADAIRGYIKNHPDFIPQCVSRVRFINMNRACLTLHNAPDKQALMRGLSDLVTDASSEALGEQIIAIATGATRIGLDSMVRTLDGRLRNVYVHWNVVPGYEESYERVIVSTEDITARKEAQDALRTSEERYRMLFNLLPYGGEALDGKGNIVACSPSTANLLGYEQSEIVGRHMSEFLSPDSLKVFQNKFSLLLEGTSQQAEINLLHKDGHLVHVLRAASPIYNKAGKVDGILAVSVDISQRIEAEEALMASERRFRSMIEKSHDAIAILDAQGRVIYETSSGSRITGFTAEERLGQSGLNLLHPDDAKDAMEALGRVIREPRATARAQYRVQRKDNTWAWVEAVATNFLEDPDVGAIVVNYRDITERRQIEEKLQREISFSDAIINSLPGIFYLFDTEGRFLRWNDNFEKISGYSKAKISAMRPTDFFEGEEKELIRERIGRVFETGYSYAEANFVSRDGAHTPFYFTGARIELDGQVCLLGVGVDVTERRRAEKMLRNLSQAINVSGDVVFMTDREGIITSVNSQFTDLYGYTPEEVVGKTTPRILKSGVQGPEVYEKFWRMILDGEMFKGRVVNKAKDGSLFHIEETVSPYMDESGNIAGFLAIQRNVTERMQAEEKLRLAEEKYRALVEQVPITMYIDEASGSSDAVYVSPQIETLLGYSPADFSENPRLWHELVDPHDYPLAHASIQQTMEERISISEYRMIARDGRSVWVRDSSVLIRDADGTPRFIQGFFEDITAQKEAEEKARLHASELEKEIAARRQAEILLEMALTQSPSGILIASAPDATIQMANTAAFNIRGGDPRLLTGIEVSEHAAKWQTYLPDGSPYPPEQLPLSRAVMRGEVTRNEEVIIRDESGVDHWVSANAAPIRDSEGTVTAGIVIFHDVTERKRMEQALVKSERDYRYLFNNAGDAILIFEPENETILQANVTACRLYGFGYDEIVGKSLKELTKNIERGKAYINAFLKGEESNIFESAHLNSDGVEIQVLINSALIEYQGRRAVLALVRDNTERKRAEEALQQSEARLSEAQRIAHLGNWEWDITKNSIWWSDETHRIFGLGPQTFKATVEGFLETIHPDDREFVVRALNQALNGDAPYDLDLRILLPDGTEKFVHEQAVVERDEAGKPARMAGISLDITERKRAEANIQKQISRLRSLREIDMAITSGFDMQVNLKTLLRLSSAELGVDAVDILLLNPTLNTLEYESGHGFRAGGIKKSRLQVGEGHAGRAAMQRAMVHIPDLGENPAQFPRAPLLADEQFFCYFGVPLITKGVVKGVMEIFHRSPLKPDQDWLDLLQTLAGQAAIAIENAQLFSNLQQSNMGLIQAYDSTIEGWSRALDLRDKETEGHTQRVTDMALKLARKFGLRNEELKFMRWGGLLHDIGKMGVPDSILFKGQSLDPEELTVMRKHPVFAYQMLSPIQYLKPALDIPYCHHERWDGSGYPRGLKGEEIPFAARIFAVADVYDALTSDRPYRNRWSKSEAAAYIRENTRSHFDPLVVDVFLEMFGAEIAKE